jgi:O-acetyl-ADP-ribose deacetylase (regulator of RNase III)
MSVPLLFRSPGSSDSNEVGMRRRISDSILELIIGDITQQRVDAIVNAANSKLAVGGGVDGAIHRAGGTEINAETRKRYPDGCPTGSALPSGAGKLPVKYIFHAVGPVWQGGRKGEPALLQSACRRCLELAIELDCRSIALPAISTGVYGYPMDRAATDLLQATTEFLHQSKPLEVRFVLFGQGAYGAFSRVLEELLPQSGG